jgi:predicted NAD/FAD-dependent oxidoreductase
LTIERAKNRERVESRHEAMTMYARPDRVENLMRMSDKDVAKAFSGELFDWMGIDEQHVAVQGIHRWKYAAAWSDPDMASRLDALTRGLERLAAEFPVWLAGDYLGTSSLSGAVTSAEESAEACISYLTRAGKLI